MANPELGRRSWSRSFTCVSRLFMAFGNTGHRLLGFASEQGQASARRTFHGASVLVLLAGLDGFDFSSS